MRKTTSLLGLFPDGVHDDGFFRRRIAAKTGEQARLSNR